MTDSQPAPSTSPAANDASSESVPQVVYVCRANGGRSAISRLLTEHYARGRVVALSAGTEPGERIHPEVAHALENLGLDTSREEPKRVTTEMVAASDIAITMGCGDNCPWSPSTEFRDWPLEDPKGQDDATVRRIMTDIDTRVRDLVVELVPASSSRRQSSPAPEAAGDNARQGRPPKSGDPASRAKPSTQSPTPPRPTLGAQ